MAQILTSIYRGDTRKIRLVFRDAAGLVFDVSGDHIFISIKEAITDPDPGPVHVDHVAGSGLLDDPGNGVVVVTIPSNQTALLDPDLNGNGIHRYEIQRVVPGAPPEVPTEVYTIEQGNLQVVRDLIVVTS